jgi:FAD/FMN-containing dehydrogenase
MPSPLVANINDGVLIDLSALKEITYNPSLRTVRVGSGNNWGDLYSALDPLNVTVAGGRIVDVGVAGLTLGGMSTQVRWYTVIFLEFTNSANKG